MAMSARLCQVLRVDNPKALGEFYRDVMGMEIIEEKEEEVVMGYKGEGAHMKLVKAEGGGKYTHTREDVYWKIGITVADVDLARMKIVEKGVEVSEASQFLDIGYMCHLSDPSGFSIELLQHTFKENFTKPDEIPSLALGQEPTIGQITLRCKDVEESLAFYRDGLGMKLLSIQEVSPYGFSLYFLAFTDESPPHEALDHVGNREWLWQRPYTTLELQHRPGKPPGPMVREGQPGFQGIEVMVEEVEMVKKRFEVEGSCCVVTDPDGVPITLASL